MKQIIVKYGTMAGVTLIVYLLLFYFWDKNMMLGAGVRWSSLLIYIVAVYLGASQVATEEFKVVMRTAFGIFIVINLFYYIFDYCLFNFLDPSLVQIEKKIMTDYFSTNVKTIEDAKALTEAIQNDNYHNLSGIAKNFAKGAIGGFGLSILMSYLVKKI